MLEQSTDFSLFPPDESSLLITSGKHAFVLDRQEFVKRKGNSDSRTFGEGHVFKCKNCGASLNDCDADSLNYYQASCPSPNAPPIQPWEMMEGINCLDW